MKPKVRIESQGRIPGNDQQQLVEGRHPGRQARAVEERVAAMDDPACPLDGELWCLGLRLTIGLRSGGGRLRFGLDFRRLAYAVDPRDSDWSPLPRGSIELLDEPPVPAGRQADILMQADHKAHAGRGRYRGSGRRLRSGSF